MEVHSLENKTTSQLFPRSPTYQLTSRDSILASCRKPCSQRIQATLSASACLTRRLESQHCSRNRWLQHAGLASWRNQASAVSISPRRYRSWIRQRKHVELYIDNLFNLILHIITVYDSFSTANLRYPLQFFISSRVFRCCRFRHTWMWMDVIGFWWVHKPRTTKKLTTTRDDIYIYVYVWTLRFNLNSTCLSMV
jgi:hypothetical protein